MTDLDEKLSYLLDDYPGDNANTALDEVIGDVNLQYSMRRYQMIGEVMRHELPHVIDTGFNISVMGRIRDEALPQAAKQVISKDSNAPTSIFSWATLKPFAGLAVAASVALVTVVLWQPVKQLSSEQFDDSLVTADQEKIQRLAEQQILIDAIPVSTNVQQLGLRWKIDREMPGIQQKLNAYLVNHTEYSNSVQGLIPQARVAGFDAQQ